MDTDLKQQLHTMFMIVATRSNPVQALSQYAMVLLMVDLGVARIVETHNDGDHFDIVVETTAGDRFEVQRPELSEEMEEMLLREIREFIHERNERAEGEGYAQ